MTNRNNFMVSVGALIFFLRVLLKPRLLMQWKLLLVSRLPNMSDISFNFNG